MYCNVFSSHLHDITSPNMIGVLFMLFFLTLPLSLHSQFSTYFPGYFDGQYWLWWVFLLLGKYKDTKHNFYFSSAFQSKDMNDIR